MAILITNQPYTAGDRGALIISGVNNSPDTDTDAVHMSIDVTGNGTEDLRFEFPANSDNDDDHLRQLNIGLNSGSRVTLNNNIWLTIDTDPARGN